MTKLNHGAVYQQDGICPECNSTRLVQDYEEAEIVCTDCGRVVKGSLTDRGPEWRAFTLEERKTLPRVGAPLNYTVHDKGLSTIIGRENRDIYGKRLKPRQKAQIYRLRKWQKRMKVQTSQERNLAKALPEIDRISDKLSLPKNIIETASVIYRKAVKERITRGRSINGVAVASLYAACRQCGLARTLDEIAQASGVNKKDIGRDYRTLVKRLDYYDLVKPPKPIQYGSKIFNQIPLNKKSEEIAYKLLNAAKEAKLTSGRDPSGIAAAASYIGSKLSGEKKTQPEIADIAQVTEVTIRNRYKELVESLDIIIPL